MRMEKKVSKVVLLTCIPGSIDDYMLKITSTNEN